MNHLCRQARRMSHEEAVDAQAVLLLRERTEIFGDEWRKNCAIRIPHKVDVEIAKIGWQAWLELPTPQL
jgi:hypothetical protein